MQALFCSFCTVKVIFFDKDSEIIFIFMLVYLNPLLYILWVYIIRYLADFYFCIYLIKLKETRNPLFTKRLVIFDLPKLITCHQIS